MIEYGIVGGLIVIISFSITLLIYKLRKVTVNETLKTKSFFFVFGAIIFMSFVGIKYLQASMLSNHYENKKSYEINIDDNKINVNGYNLDGRNFKLISELFEVPLSKLEDFSPMGGLWEARDITPLPIMKTSVLKSDNPVFQSLIINFNQFNGSVVLNGRKIERYMSVKELKDNLDLNFITQGANRTDFKSLIYKTTARKIFFSFNNDKLTDMEVYLVDDTMKYLK